jgi:catechol 2,3-dioxygenase-like lactoylglutathione lyase family enzyme
VTDAAAPAAPRVHHVALRCADLELAERFYREVLGLEVLRRWPRPEGGDRSVWLGLGAGFLALERAADGGGAPAPEGPEAPGWHLVALSIGRAEREAWESRLASHGVAVERRSPWSLFFRDPESNRVALSHWPEEA